MEKIDYPEGGYKLSEADMKELANRFAYHSPKQDQIARYNLLRGKAMELAITIIENCPKCREQAVALTNLEQSLFWANAAIARNEKHDNITSRVEAWRAKQKPDGAE